MRVPKNLVITKLREQGYVFKRQGNRREIWRRRGHPDYLDVPTNNAMDPIIAKTLLIQSGIAVEEVNELLREYL